MVALGQGKGIEGLPQDGRLVCFDASEGYVDTPVLWRDDLRPGQRIHGPAIVEEFGSTVPVHPGFRATVDRHGNLLIERAG